MPLPLMRRIYHNSEKTFLERSAVYDITVKSLTLIKNITVLGDTVNQTSKDILNP